MDKLIAFAQGIGIGGVGLAVFSYCQMQMSKRTNRIRIMELLDAINNEIKTISDLLDSMGPEEEPRRELPDVADQPQEDIQEPTPIQNPTMGIHSKPGANVIMTILEDAPTGFNQLGKLSGLSKSTLSRAIKALNESGRIEKGDDGLWHAHA